MSKINQEQYDVVQTDNAFAREGCSGLILLFRVFMRRKWLIAAILLVSLFLAGGYLLKVSPVYSSSSKIYVEQAGPKLLGDEPGLMTLSKNYLYTQCTLMTSDVVLKKVVDDPAISALESLAKATDKVAYLKGIIITGVGKKDDVISVSCSVPYPDEAASIINAVVKSYISFHADRKAYISGEVRRGLEAERKRQYDDLEKMRQRILDFGVSDSEVDLLPVASQRPQSQSEVGNLNRQIPLSGGRNAGLNLMLLDFQWQQFSCDAIDSRISELNVSDEAGILNITVFEEAKASSVAIKPHGFRVIMIAIIAGLATGCLLTLLLDMVTNEDKGNAGRSGGLVK